MERGAGRVGTATADAHHRVRPCLARGRRAFGPCASSNARCADDLRKATDLASRRQVLRTTPIGLMAVVLTGIYTTGGAQAKERRRMKAPAAVEEEEAPHYLKTPLGVTYIEVTAGAGKAAGVGDTVLLDYVLRRPNGYFIYATREGVSFQPSDIPVGPVSFTLGSGDLIVGLEDVLVGMQPGGKRRALVPPDLGYVFPGNQPQPPTYATQRQLNVHSKGPLLFEIELLKVNPGK